MCIPPSQSKILSRMAYLLFSNALSSRASLNPGEWDALSGGTSLIKGKMIVKFMGSASRMHAKTSSCRIGRGVRLEDRTAGWRSGVASLESRAPGMVIAGAAREAEDITWGGKPFLTLGRDKPNPGRRSKIVFHIT